MLELESEELLQDCLTEVVLGLSTAAFLHHRLLVCRAAFKKLCPSLREMWLHTTPIGMPLCSGRISEGSLGQLHGTAPLHITSPFDYLFFVSCSYGGCKRCCRRCSSRCRISERQVLGGQRESPRDHLRPGKSCGRFKKVSRCTETCGQELHPHPLIY